MERRTARNDDRNEVVGRENREAELGRERKHLRGRQHDRTRKVHDGADGAVVVRRAGSVTILRGTCRLRLGGHRSNAGSGRPKQILGMHVAERQRQLQQQREEPEARAKAPYRPQSAHPCHRAAEALHCYSEATG